MAHIIQSKKLLRRSLKWADVLKGHCRDKDDNQGVFHGSVYQSLPYQTTQNNDPIPSTIPHWGCL